MELSQIKDWILAISASVTLISVAIGVWLSLREYRLKLQAERRLEKSAQIESEIRLLTLFTELMDVANGRSGYYVSEKAVEFILTRIKVDEIGTLDLEALNQSLEDLAILNLPVGSAQQDASFAAIASLTQRHEILRDVGIQALESLTHSMGSPNAKRYLEKIRSNISNRQG